MDLAATQGLSITALMPVKNYQPRFLREALESIFAQTSAQWRLLVVAEPQDATALEVVLSNALRDSRVRMVINQGRKLAGAFNTGMRAAETEFVAILLGDDLWAPTAVEVLAERIRAYPEADLLHSALQVIDDEGRPIGTVRHPPEKVSLSDFVWGSPVKHLLCWRRSKALSLGGMDESLNNIGPDDYDFPWTMLEHGAGFQSVDECLYEYRDHRDAYRLTTHLPRSVHIRELRRILEKHGVEIALIEERLWSAKRTFLRQCLFQNELDRWLKEKIIGIDPRRGWREAYKRWNAPKCRGHADPMHGGRRDIDA